MMNRHIAVDMDDVVVDFIGGVRRSFELEFGIDGLAGYQGSPWGQDVVAFSKHSLFREAGYEDWWGWLRDRDWLWGIFPAVEGAIGGIKRLREQGYYIEAVTSKPQWARPQVWRWCGKWRPDFHSITIVEPGQRKIDYTYAGLIIDDKRQTCEEFEEAGRRAILFDPGQVSKARDLYAVKDWGEVVEWVPKLLA